MDPAIAHSIASQTLEGQRTRFGDPVIDHLARVAAAVPPDARATALLHDLLELCPIPHLELQGRGLTRVELDALELLTHVRDEPYKLYIRRIAVSPGRLARVVKLADLDDHLAHATIPSDAPPYAWRWTPMSRVGLVLAGWCCVRRSGLRSARRTR